MSGMMFLEYAIIGAWGVTLPTFLMAPPESGGWGLSATRIGLLYTTFAIGATVSPMIVGLMADRHFSTQRILAVLHLCGAGLLAAMAAWCEAFAVELPGLPPTEAAELARAAYWPLFALMLFNALCYQPTFALTNSISLRNLHDPDKHFGQVRAFGTVGYAVTLIGIGLTLDPVSVKPLTLGSLLSLMMSVYCLALPHTPPLGRSKSLADSLGLSALGMFRRPEFRAYVAAVVPTAALLSFYNAYTNRYMIELGVPAAAAFLTVSQATEVVALLSIPAVLRRLGVRGLFVIGFAAAALRFAAFWTGSAVLVVAVGLPLHGLGFAFAFIGATGFVDRLAPKELRSSVQGLLQLLTGGLSSLVGHLFAGWVIDRNTSGGVIDWPAVWSVPAVGVGAAAVAFALTFREPGAGESK